MNCRDVDSLLAAFASGADVPPEAAAHIAGCARCGPLVRALGFPEPARQATPERLRQIEDEMLADFKPVRRLPAPRLLSLALIALLLAVVAIGVALLGDAGWHARSVAQRIAMYTALAAAVGVLAGSLARQAAPGSRWRIAPNWLVGGAWAALVLIPSVLFQAHAEPTFIATGLFCLRIGLTCAIPAGLLFWLVLRRGAVLNPRMAGLTAGTLAGLAGVVVLEIFCPNLNRNHILTWHLGAAVLSAAAGLGIGAAVERRGWKGRKARG